MSPTGDDHDIRIRRAQSWQSGIIRTTAWISSGSCAIMCHYGLLSSQTWTTTFYLESNKYRHTHAPQTATLPPHHLTCRPWNVLEWFNVYSTVWHNSFYIYVLTIFSYVSTYILWSFAFVQLALACHFGFLSLSFSLCLFSLPTFLHLAYPVGSFSDCMQHFEVPLAVI